MSAAAGAAGPLVLAVSSRALFDLEGEATVFRESGLDAFAARQRDLEHVPLAPGPAFPLVRALLALNGRAPAGAPPFVQCIVVSGQHPDTGLRVLGSIAHHGLDIRCATFTGGAPIAPYLAAFGVGLLLSRSQEDAQQAVDLGIAAAAMYDAPKDYAGVKGCVRIAFDGDAVIFSDESEALYKREGLAAFRANELARARDPMEPGPHGAFLLALHRIREAAPDALRIALVTARGAPAHERALRTLRAWGVGVDEAFFLDGRPKAPVLKAFAADVFFDDQVAHLGPASLLVPSGRVPYRGGGLAGQAAPEAA